MAFAPIVTIRLSYWRQAVASTPCRECGAAAGRACDCGQPDGENCANCGRVSTCPRGCRIHLSRLNTWLRPAPVVPDTK